MIRDRLAKLGAHGERWASWKDEERGWIVKLEFTADTIDHDARWGFEPRKQSLQPMNSEAITLSQQGELKGGLIPRLRAVGPESDESRFDSGAFTFEETDEAQQDTAPHLEPLPYARTTPGVEPGGRPCRHQARRRAEAGASARPPTCSRRCDVDAGNARRPAPRSQPQLPAPVEPARREAPQAGGARSLDRREARRGCTHHLGRQDEPGRGRRPRGAKKGRASMPSWDEIVFGARTDDDLA